MDDQTTETTIIDNRVTVALVSQQVTGLADLTKAGFGDVQRQLDKLDGLPHRVTKLEAQGKALEDRVDAIEQDEKDERRWRRSSLLMIACTCVSAGAAIVAVLH